MPETTERGFRVYTTFHDSNGHRTRVQQSSAATEPKVWIFCDSPVEMHPPHLTVEHAKMVRAALDRFIAEAAS